MNFRHLLSCDTVVNIFLIKTDTAETKTSLSLVSIKPITTTTTTNLESKQSD